MHVPTAILSIQSNNFPRMDESQGAQYALHIALQTLKERCHQFQKRIAILEEENLSLRLVCDANEQNNADSLSEIDRLKLRVCELTEHVNQHQKNSAMVTNENRKLWSRLSKLSAANKTMGDHITKVNTFINDPKLQQNHSPLIRSKTFTQEESPIKHNTQRMDLSEGSTKISLELEDISLKFRESSGEYEIETGNIEIPKNFGNLLSNSLAFDYQNEVNKSNFSTEYLEHNLSDLRAIKALLLGQKERIISDINTYKNCKVEYDCDKCSTKITTLEADKTIKNVEITPLNLPEVNIPIISEEKPVKMAEEVRLKEELDSLANWVTPENSNAFLHGKDTNIIEKICPMCTKVFTNVTFETFLEHVEAHFIEL